MEEIDGIDERIQCARRPFRFFSFLFPGRRRTRARSSGLAHAEGRRSDGPFPFFPNRQRAMAIFSGRASGSNYNYGASVASKGPSPFLPSLALLEIDLDESSSLRLTRRRV